MLTIGIITLFPNIIDALNYGVVGRAIKKNLLSVTCWNPRDYTNDAHRTVDDRPYGGGPGMVLKFAPVKAAIEAAQAVIGKNTKVIHLTPQGQPLTQAVVIDQVKNNALILLAGRYEGIDERLIESVVDEQWSVGDYVVSGGELPAMIMVDAMTRLLPGALGHEDSATQDSFTTGLLDYPHYTRPEQIAGKTVPAVLLSGDHAAIARWRYKQALGRTWQRRKDLLKRLSLTKNERRLLNEFIAECDEESS